MTDLEAIAIAEAVKRRRAELESFVTWYETSSIGRNWHDLAAETRIRLHEVEKLLEAGQRDAAQEVLERRHEAHRAVGDIDCRLCELAFEATYMPAMA